MGDCSPVATAESVRADITRIRLLFRFTTCFLSISSTVVHAVDNLTMWQCKPFEKEMRINPRKASVSIPTIQPPQTATVCLIQETTERSGVP